MLVPFGRESVADPPYPAALFFTCCYQPARIDKAVAGWLPCAAVRRSGCVHTAAWQRGGSIFPRLPAAHSAFTVVKFRV
jgi:hypothetical protein